MLEMVNAEWGWGGSSPKLLPDINIVYNVGHHPSLRQGGGVGQQGRGVWYTKISEKQFAYMAWDLLHKLSRAGSTKGNNG